VLDAQGRLASGFAPLVADAGPSAPYFRGAATALSTPSAASVFLLNSSGFAPGTGRLVHAASGLCLDAGAVPTSHGCLDRAVRGLPFCDAARPVAERVADLLSRMTLAEKIGLTGADLKKDGSCDTKDAGVPRLGVPPMQWLVETNSMAASSCYNGSCATSFPSAQNLASSFNRSVFHAKGVVVGTEMRALNNLQWHRADGIPDSMQSLSGFGPDINQPRDPRNGRAGELPSEDRFVMAQYAAEYVQGCQNSSGSSYWTMITGLKHFAGYSLETGRFGSKGNFSLYDLFDTYLPPFEAGFVAGGSAGSMCSYISLAVGANSTPVPACANSYILQTLVREYWGRPDATHTSDCGAVSNMADANHYVSNHTLAAAAFLNGGADLNSEYTVPQELPLALALGLVNESTVDAAISRTLGHRFRVGMLDPFELQPEAFFTAGQAEIGAPASARLVQEAAAQGVVLLRNAGSALPLRRGSKLLLLGPLGACDRCLMGDYYADMVCVGGGFACVPTLSAALAAANAAGSLTTIAGVSVHGNDSSWGAAIAAVAAADTVLLALGTDETCAGEGTDLSDIGLPGVQSQFGLAVLAAAAAAAKPVVLLLVSAFPTAFDELAAAGPAAVVLVYAPTFGAPAVAAQLLGDTNRWGRAVMTVYPHAYQNAVSLFDFSIAPGAGNPGRTYRYYDGSAGAPLVRFGEGISYSHFETACAGAIDPASGVIGVQCNISNAAGSPEGDQVLLVFHRASADVIARIGAAHPVPLASLVAFERFSLPAGGTAAAAFSLRASESLALVDASGASVLYQGLHYLDVWDGGAFNVTIALEVPGSSTVVRRPPLPPSAAA
jgi:beta-D-xylosidase 4